MPKHHRHGQASILSDRDFLEIKKNLESPRDRLIVDILNYTGERIGAVLKLQISDVYLSPSKGEPNEFVTFRAATRKADTKGARKTRQVPMHGELHLALAGYQSHLDLNSLWLFPGKDKTKPLTLQAFDLNLRAALLRAKLSHKGISTHSFRRFQSLIGIMRGFNRPPLEGLMYLVFEVRFRLPIVKVPFGRSLCQDRLMATRLKTFLGKDSKISPNPISTKTGAKPLQFPMASKRSKSIVGARQQQTFWLRTNLIDAVPLQ